MTNVARDGSTGLLGLPAELRLQIYDRLLPTLSKRKTRIVPQWSTITMAAPSTYLRFRNTHAVAWELRVYRGVISCCRTIYAEASRLIEHLGVVFDAGYHLPLFDGRWKYPIHPGLDAKKLLSQ